MIKVNGEVVTIEHFPDGTQRLNVIPKEYCVLEWVYEKEEELSTLIYTTQHLKNYPASKIILMLRYCPNSRMDRTKNKDEVFTLKYFADVINWLNFDCVYILDIHSNVGAALFDRARLITPQHIIKNVIQKINADDLILYFPDASAAKRYSEMFPTYQYVYGEKNRDWKTGKILGLNVINNLNIDLTGRTVLMIDDICSYGGTMYYGALALQNMGVTNIYAYASHTENSVLDRERGTLIKSLEDGTVTKLFTTRSLFTKDHAQIEIMEV